MREREREKRGPTPPPLPARPRDFKKPTHSPFLAPTPAPPRPHRPPKRTMWTVLFSFQAAISQASSLTASVLLVMASRAAILPAKTPVSFLAAAAGAARARAAAATATI